MEDDMEQPAVPGQLNVEAEENSVFNDDWVPPIPLPDPDEVLAQNIIAGISRTMTSSTVTAGAAEIWNRFVGWFKEMFGTLLSLNDTYDEEIANLEAALESEGGDEPALAHLSIAKRTDELRVVGSKDQTHAAAILKLFAQVLKVQPIRMTAAVEEAAGVWVRDISIPRIPETLRPQVMAAIDAFAVKPEVKEAMDLLVKYHNAKAEHARKLAEVTKDLDIPSMPKASEKAAALVLEHVKSLKNKQSRLENVLFRADTRVKRGNINYKGIVEALKKNFAANDKATKMLAALVEKATTEKETVDALDVVIEEIPQDAREQLREISAPAAGEAPAEVKSSLRIPDVDGDASLEDV